MLHVTNGDCLADKLREAGLPGRIFVEREMLHEGPTPEGVGPREWRELRADFFAANLWAPRGAIIDYLVAREQALEASLDEDEVVRWFEHDLYDQLLLIRLLHWYESRERKPALVTLICIGEYPGIERFIGLGQLHPRQLAALFARREPVTREEYELGSATWQAFRMPTPEDLEPFVTLEGTLLPWLPGALLRHLEQFPNTSDGLARGEWQILKAVSEGLHHPRELFAATQEMEERPYLGDSTFYTHLLGLCAGEDPLLQLGEGHAPLRPPMPPAAPPPEFFAQDFVLTENGEAVLYRKADAIELRGIDRWLGGVHLEGREAAWRWDAANGLLVNCL